MLFVSIGLFAVAALGGLVLAGVRLRSEVNPPLPVALLHGALAASGLVALGLHVTAADYPPAPTAGLALLVVAALGGFALLATHVRGTLIAAPLVVVHALAAVSGFLALLWAAM